MCVEGPLGEYISRHGPNNDMLIASSRGWNVVMILDLGFCGEGFGDLVRHMKMRVSVVAQAGSGVNCEAGLIQYERV